MNRDTTYCLPSVVVVVVVLVSGLILPCSECAYDIEEKLCLWITVLDIWINQILPVSLITRQSMEKAALSKFEKIHK